MKLTCICKALNRRTQIRRKQRIRNRLPSYVSYLLVATLLCLAQPIISTHAAPGDLDPTFGNGGKVTDWSGSATDVAIQPDGKIVVAGQVNGWFGVARYNSDGSPDPTFGGGTGKVTTTNFFEASATSIAIQPDGRIVVAGITWDSWGYQGTALVRYNPAGSLDTSFDADGVVGVPLRGGHDVAIQPNGKILVGGDSGDSGFGLARFNPNGSLDAGFGSGGIVTTTISDQRYDMANSIALQSDGKIVAAGVAFALDVWASNIAIVRYNANGSVDAGFGNNGVVITQRTSVWNTAHSVAMQADGKIVVAGIPAVVRYMADGSLDTGFGSSGIVTHPATVVDLQAIAVQSDGRIVVSGTSSNGSNNDFALVRYNPIGSMDSTFGDGDGITAADFNHSTDKANGMALDGQGRAVVIGESDQVFAIARFLLGDGPSPTPTPTPTTTPTPTPTASNNTDFDYDGDGRADLSVRRLSNNIWYLLRATAGYTAQKFGVAGDRITPSDYDGDGKTDVSVFRPSNGTWYMFMSESQTFRAFGWGQNGDLPVPTDRDADGKTDLVIFRPSNNTWYTRFANGTFHQFQFGVAGDKPVVGDFDGDGIGDVALFRPSNNNWYIIKSSLGFFIQTWGQAGDTPTTGDFDGDGATDQAVFTPSTGQWYLSQTNAGFSVRNWGQTGDVPVAADYDGDGKTDVAVFRPSNGTWYIVNSTAGIRVQQFGQEGDMPTQSAFNY